MRYQIPPFTREIIPATTEACFYPPPTTDGTNPRPIILYPEFHVPDGTPNSPRALRLRVKTTEGTPLPEAVLAGYVCCVNSDGSLTRVLSVFTDEAFNGGGLLLSAPIGAVIEKVETEIPLGFELDGWSDQAQQSA